MANSGFWAQGANGGVQTVPDDTFTVVLFTTVIFNDGNDYEGATGTYTAPANGVYHFSANVLNQNFLIDKETVLFLMVNGNQVAGNITMASVNPNPGTVFKSANSNILNLTIKLKKHDKVQVAVLNAAPNGAPSNPELIGSGATDMVTNFSGYRVY